MTTQEQRMNLARVYISAIVGIGRRYHLMSEPPMVIGLPGEAQNLRLRIRVSNLDPDTWRRKAFPPATYSPKGAVCHTCGQEIEHGQGRRFRLRWMHEHCLPETRKNRLITRRESDQTTGLHNGQAPTEKAA